MASSFSSTSISTERLYLHLFTDYHYDMNRKVFQDWCENVLQPKLPKERNLVIAIDNAKYHSRKVLVERTPSINMKKDDLIKYMIKQNIDVPNTIPAKPVLLEKIREKNIPKQYVIDSMAQRVDYDVLRLFPYHCVFNPIEMMWNQIKYHNRRFNVYTSQSLKLVDLI